MIIVRLAWLSLRNRWVTAVLAICSIAVSVALFLGVEKVRNGARESFGSTISGTDLVVGARTGAIPLLLYSVFRIGNATNNMSWQSYERIAAHPDVAWTIPLSLGDSHRGFRVLGTSADYFRYYRFRSDRKLEYSAGKTFSDLFDAVIGAKVAAELNYKVGDRIIIAHGISDIGASDHKDKPFRVSGILKSTGTPVDRTVHVSLEAIEAVHLGWRSGRPPAGTPFSADDVRKLNLKPRTVTASLVGLKSRFAVFRVQRFVNNFRVEPLMAVLPGVTLYELWEIVSPAEMALLVVSILVVITALIGMMAVILATLQERRREIAILRSVGASPRTIVAMLTAEGFILTALGTLAGTILLYGALFALRPVIDDIWGLSIAIGRPSPREAGAIAAIILAGLVVSLIPAWRACRMPLSQGMLVTR